MGGTSGSPALARSHALRGSVAPTLRVARPEQAPRRMAGSALSVAGTRSVPKRLPRRAWEPVGGKRGSPARARSHALRGSVAPTLRVARPEQAPRRMAGSAVSVAGTRSVPKRLPRRAWEPVGGERGSQLGGKRGSPALARSHALRGSVAPTLRVARPEQAARRMAGSAVSVAGTPSVPKRLPRRAWEPVGGEAWEPVGGSVGASWGEAWEPSGSSLPRSAWECRRDAPRREAGAGGSAHGGIRGVGGRDAERPEEAPTQSVGAKLGGSVGASWGGSVGARTCTGRGSNPVPHRISDQFCSWLEAAQWLAGRPPSPLACRPRVPGRPAHHFQRRR
ncbi:hypothetical protein BDD21_2682 [Thiocapsa rosea]|uniref:Uncharacterized protein n=1 Tax=Thiocapsa rosea TaxID=69360 RepID=A0A495V937_9GAMM|nr:hypothetical protein BDD21_2682 [Thiocapsa rosea]